MDILGAIGNTSMVRLRKVVPTIVTLVADSGLKYLSTDVYRTS
jgi:hypothetical protein